MSTTQITKNITTRTYREADIPNTDHDDYYHYGVQASHPDYPELTSKSATFKNVQRNTDLALIRLLSNIAEQERKRANDLHDAFGILFEARTNNRLLSTVEEYKVNVALKNRS